MPPSPFWQYQRRAIDIARQERDDPSEAYVLGVMARIQREDFHARTERLFSDLANIHSEASFRTGFVNVCVEVGKANGRPVYRLERAPIVYTQAEQAAIDMLESEIRRAAREVLGHSDVYGVSECDTAQTSDLSDKSQAPAKATEIADESTEGLPVKGER